MLFSIFNLYAFLYLILSSPDSMLALLPVVFLHISIFALSHLFSALKSLPGIQMLLAAFLYSYIMDRR